MTGIVDRFEGDYAIIEMDGQLHEVKSEQLESRVRVGDVVKWCGDLWSTDKQATEARKENVKQLMDEVWDD
ncbi:DUF3006 domain-containing protein [Paenibacillus harenae]|uniref:DUF3006 domain-containing protein n=1 Tax=Paenibacillus harenae TaxID=306543 RepID=A0ABT9TZU3_PAEHA|nr:DUF3006 domain-containing protein [Paenibacillus harenae]MDQ0059497.1 hypothetical protein [Paenibacillus harenae]MDQ0112912.1 hypothetical protein [Paenibacillus harenae]